MIARIHSEPENLASDTGTDMFRTAENLAEAAVPELGDIVTVELLELTLRGEVPPPGALCGSTPLRRAAFRSRRGASGVRPAYAVGDMIPVPPTTPYRQTLAHLRPRLIRELNDDSLWLARDAARARVMREARVHSLVVVPLVVQGVVLGLVALYRRADSGPYDAGDLQAAATFAERAALCIDLVRRRIQERARARLLQRALLPEALPSLSALEAARSHVPVEGSGGEWFDIIPLSGARVALVVGATEGEGADTAVGMSQLRAMILTLALQDLAPDEILSCLDEVASRLDREHEAHLQHPFGLKYVGSSCICVVYDPVTAHCSLSRAGDADLVVVHPDGTVNSPILASHPPLGAGGQPFEATEIDVHSGSILLLNSGGDDAPLCDAQATAERLYEVLSRSGPDAQEILEAVRWDVSCGHEPVVLVTRTRAFDADNVATRSLPPDAAAVAAARRWTGRQLARWMLNELAYTTALIVSELVTNAIRYSTGPVELRLINDDRTLICEVSDTSSAAPRLRKPERSDESGRGLPIVTQLTQHQGTRYTASGKTVWTEQDLPT
ncbi:histidine kinase-like protein [Streptomyces sp. 3212.3]|uniref:ATP-binding SpoIIE family protein phosphatase n=1 Tax=unclassified Streptomyces TaxID=2593676 RepID=UPI000E3942F9|nr:ATP-binding SpoIIE family protein phosphatase [Streptomyces sp. 3212.3]REE59014.1 histidine kinase-like protein [Streptomyces sp. 3212.3]